MEINWHLSSMQAKCVREDDQIVHYIERLPSTRLDIETETEAHFVVSPVRLSKLPSV